MDTGKEMIMNRIDIKRFGMAWGITSSLLYLGCMLVMWSAGKEGSILFFNSLMHGIDVTTIIRMNMPWWEMLMGIVEIFIIGWLIGATIASIYNLGLKKTKRS